VWKTILQSLWFRLIVAFAIVAVVAVGTVAVLAKPGHDPGDGALPDPRHASVQVTDTSIGIPLADLPYVFRLNFGP